MGRKIPKSKRHKKIKAIDPFYNGERKRLLYKNEDKFDVPPKDIDNQEIPRKLLDLMERKEKMKIEITNNTKPIKRKRKKTNLNFKMENFGEKQPGMKKPLKPVTEFKKRNGESDQQFVARVGKMTQEILEQSKLEDKFDVDFVEDKKGDLTTNKRQNENLEYEIRKKMRGINTEKKQKTSEKATKRKIKEKEKKLKQKEWKMDEFKLMKDEIQFGEVVTEPPTFNFNQNKRIKTNSLILHKKLTPIQALRIDSERIKAVAAYRKLKTKII